MRPIALWTLMGLALSATAVSAQDKKIAKDIVGTWTAQSLTFTGSRWGATSAYPRDLSKMKIVISDKGDYSQPFPRAAEAKLFNGRPDVQWSQAVEPRLLAKYKIKTDDKKGHEIEIRVLGGETIKGTFQINGDELRISYCLPNPTADGVIPVNFVNGVGAYQWVLRRQAK